MFRFSTAAAAALGLVLVLGSARADQYVSGARTTGTRVTAPYTPGARGDITVPYLTSGNSLQLGNGVAPIVYAAPTLSNPAAPGIEPNYNLIYYGAAKGFSGVSVGSTQRAPNQLRR
jgi:hypothetical protein